MYEIKKCPYCGGDAELCGRKRYRVVCANCKAQGPVKPIPSQAIEAWISRSEVMKS